MSSRSEERRAGQSRLIGLHQDDGSFDRAFWRETTPAQRLEQAWTMVEEYLAWRGDAGQPRLQRSVLRLQRRER